MFVAAALIVATMITTPVRVGIRVPDSVTIAMPSTISLPTPGPQLNAPSPGASPAPLKPGATPSPAGSQPQSATQAMADEIAAQITKQMDDSMGASQTKPLVTVEYVQPALSSPFSTPSPNAGGDYVATINF